MYCGKTIKFETDALNKYIETKNVNNKESSIVKEKDDSESKNQEKKKDMTVPIIIGIILGILAAFFKPIFILIAIIAFLIWLYSDFFIK